MDPFLLIMSAGFFLILWVYIISPCTRFLSNSLQPVRSAKARLIAKWSQMSSQASQGQSSGQFDYYCMFETKSGQRRKFRVSEPEYRHWTEGAVGILVYQGT